MNLSLATALRLTIFPSILRWTRRQRSFNSPHLSLTIQIAEAHRHYSTNTTTATKRRAKIEMTPLPGGCYCGAVRFTITLANPATEARTSLCHCGSCKRFTGGEHGITTKAPRTAFALAPGAQDYIRVHEADNGSGTLLHREFCGTCGGPLLEYGVSGFLLCLRFWRNEGYQCQS